MNISTHAQMRMQNRGITKELFSLHQRFADREAFVGSGCSSWTITNQGVNAMVDSGISIQTVDKVRRLAIIYGGDGTIVTALPMVDGKAKNYTRGARRRSHGRRERNSKEKLRKYYRG